jgi:hypothetical protein
MSASSSLSYERKRIMLEKTDVTMDWAVRTPMPSRWPAGCTGMASLPCKPEQGPAREPCRDRENKRLGEVLAFIRAGPSIHLG